MTTAISPFGLKRKIFLIGAGTLLVALLAACGGGGSDDAGDNSSSTPNTSSKDAFANLNSYKYSMKLSGNGGPLSQISGELGDNSTNVAFEVGGAYIKPDKAQTSIKAGGLETSTVIVGNQQWNTFAGQTQGPLPATASDVQDANFLASFWSGESLAGNVKDFKCSAKENVNGVSALKCTADKATLQKIAQDSSGLLQGMNATTLNNGNADVWLADAGFPVRMRMDISGKDTDSKDFSIKVEMDVTDINGNFQITPPKS